MKKPKMSDVHEWIDNLINYVDMCDNKEVQRYYCTFMHFDRNYQNKTASNWDTDNAGFLL
jgi:hypothetical protein